MRCSAPSIENRVNLHIHNKLHLDLESSELSSKIHEYFQRWTNRARGLIAEKDVYLQFVSIGADKKVLDENNAKNSNQAWQLAIQ